VKNLEFVIKELVEKLSEDDIKNYALKENVTLTNEELKTIYMYIKNYWQDFYRGDCKELFIELKEKLKPNTYNKIIELYSKYKRK